MTAAADELVVTQPSVSAAVTALARELGTPLLDREGRGVRPTPAGLAFAAYAADVVGLLESGRRAAGEAAGVAARTLRIGAVTTAAESFVPALMHAFAQARPDIELALNVGNRGQVIDRLLAHEIDLAFGGRPPETDRVTARAVRPNPLVLICAADDPLAGAAVAPRALVGRSWLLREPGSGTRALNEEYLAAQAIDVAPLTVGSNGAIKAAARAGLGVSLVSQDAVTTELENGLLATIAVDPAPAPRDWHVMRPRVGPVRPVVTEFLDFVRAHR